MLRALQSSNRFRVKAVSIPAPVGGLNSRDSIDAMAPTDAIIMSNFSQPLRKLPCAMALHSFAPA